MEELDRAGIEAEIQYPIFLRRSHSLILFNLLPRYIAAQLGTETFQPEHDGTFGELMSCLAHLKRDDILSNTALIFESAFSLIDERAEVLKRCWCEHQNFG